MRRIMMSLLGAVVGTVLLVGLKTDRLAHPLDYSAAPSGDGDFPGTPTVQPGQSGEPAGPGVPGQAPAATPTGTAAVPGGAPMPSTTATKPGATTTTTAPPASRTITGTAVAAIWKGENYGNMQVKIVVTGRHIDDIITIAQSNRPKSVSTTLRTQALTAQSANVGNVSGATASSTAYKQSLAAAIAKI
jgi:uncharacterized protein with FMN-binding domain